MKESVIAIITARGGSKRIPRKNIKSFCGKPIIAYSIEAAIGSELFDDVMVSTDDDEISDVARQFGATVPFIRSAKNSDDQATTSDVLEEVLTEYFKHERYFKYACCLYPTAPFITSSLLKDSFRMFISSKADTLIPVVKFSYPPQRGFVEENGFIRFKHPEYMNSRSQDLERMYHDSGQFYFFNVESFMKSGSILNGRIKAIELSEMEVQDIDNESDWRLAELKYRMIKNIDL